MRKEQDNSVQSIHHLLLTELNFGLRASADPSNADLPDLVIRVTTIYSPWFGRNCKVCFDRFREGDLVRLCPLCGTAYHDDGQYDLHCWQHYFENKKTCASGKDKNCVFTLKDAQHNDDNIDSNTFLAPQYRILVPLTTFFLSGIERVWRPYGEQQGEQVDHSSKFIGRICPWCRNRIRVGDRIVQCPCKVNCGTVFHQDIFRHLTCWNEWNGVSGNQFCPTTGAPYLSKDINSEERD